MNEKATRKTSVRRKTRCGRRKQAGRKKIGPECKQQIRTRRTRCSMKAQETFVNEKATRTHRVRKTFVARREKEGNDEIKWIKKFQKDEGSDEVNMK